MVEMPMPHRRHFLALAAAAGAGLMIGSGCREAEPVAAFRATDKDAAFKNAWLHVNETGAITFFVPNSEMGQGVQTALTQIVADEMDADWTAIKTVFAPYHSTFDNPEFMVQVTGASSSVRTNWGRLRKIGAAAREMFVEAAAAEWGAEARILTTENSTVRHLDGRVLGYGALAHRAAALPPPRGPKLKSADAWTLIGAAVKRLDTPAKIGGKPIYGIDVQVPGLLTAAIIQSPVFGGTPASWDENAALRVRGVEAVVPGDGWLAVVADGYWHANTGADALAATFDGNGNETRSSAAYAAEMAAALAAVDKVDGAGGPVLDLEFSTPLQAHQPLEPMNCTAWVSPSACKIWAPTQNQQASMVAARAATGLPTDRIEIVTTYLGGGFGRRLEADYVGQAATIAKAIGRPVKLIWSREEDMRHDFYRPPNRVRFQIALRENGQPKTWKADLISASHFKRALKANLPGAGWLPVETFAGDSSMIMGLRDGEFPYAVGDLDVDYRIHELHVPTGEHRAVQHNIAAFAVEVAMDECARAAGQDPLSYRRRLLAEEPRIVGVLDLVAEKAGWGAPPPGRHHGLSVHRSFGTAVAAVAEISLDGDRLTIHRIVCAVDCGQLINPAIAHSQIEGGVLWGLECALFSRIDVEDGAVVQSNFHDYRLLHLAEAPPVEVHFVESIVEPTGLGEPGAPPVAAALSNAVFAAGGRRIRALPFADHGISI